MNDINNSEGVEQVDKAFGALERPRSQMDPQIREEEETALKQMIAGGHHSCAWNMDGGNDELRKNADEDMDTN
eukprot:5985635-Pleurochrysis_carterae.AAC.2